MEVIDSLLRRHGADLVAALTEKTQLDKTQAERFVPEAARDVGNALGSSALDLGSLLGGDVSDLLSRLDVGSLASRTGLHEGQAQSALGALLPALLSLVQQDTGGLEGLASALGRKDLGGLLSKASKIFGT